MEITPIGKVRSCFWGKFATPRQPGLCPSAWGELVFDEAFRDPSAVRGLEGFSHVWLIFGFHETVNQGWQPTVRPPRLGGNKRVGVFATRSTFRPNGLGLSLVKLTGVEVRPTEGPVLLLGGLDLIDGTPIYDVKPYLPYAESVPDALAGFAPAAPEVLQVVISKEAASTFKKLPVRVQNVIRECLAQDPRPAVQGGDEERLFGAVLCGYDVQFQIAGEECRIIGVRKL
jgi:tRNA-Thr(GGU) m(6)t(6)A37 methyltransferase TsaA